MHVMINMYDMLMLMLWNVNACLTPRGVTDQVNKLPREIAVVVRVQVNKLPRDIAIVVRVQVNKLPREIAAVVRVQVNILPRGSPLVRIQINMQG
jgi:hypothetical protein